MKASHRIPIHLLFVLYDAIYLLNVIGETILNKNNVKLSETEIPALFCKQNCTTVVSKLIRLLAPVAFKFPKNVLSISTEKG